MNSKWKHLDYTLQLFTLSSVSLVYVCMLLSTATHVTSSKLGHSSVWNERNDKGFHSLSKQIKVYNLYLPQSWLSYFNQTISNFPEKIRLHRRDDDDIFFRFFCLHLFLYISIPKYHCIITRRFCLYSNFSLISYNPRIIQWNSGWDSWGVKESNVYSEKEIISWRMSFPHPLSRSSLFSIQL